MSYNGIGDLVDDMKHELVDHVKVQIKNRLRYVKLKWKKNHPDKTYTKGYKDGLDDALELLEGVRESECDMDQNK